MSGIGDQTDHAQGLRLGRRMLIDGRRLAREMGCEAGADADTDFQARGQALMQSLQLALNTDAHTQTPAFLFGLAYAIGSMAGQMSDANRRILAGAMNGGFVAGAAAIDAILKPQGHA